MSKITGGAGFWSGGRRAHRKVLSEQRASQLAALREALDKAEDPQEIARLEGRMEEVNREFDRRKRESGGLLFWR